MAQDIGLDLESGGPSVTLLSSNLTDGSESAQTAAADLGTPTPLGVGYELKLDCQASSDGFAFLKVAWSHDNTDFSNADNSEIIAQVDCTASTVVTKSGSFRARSRYVKFSLLNRSGGTINSASTALVLTDEFVNQV